MKISFIIIRVVLLDVKVGLAQRGVGGGGSGRGCGSSRNIGTRND